MKTERGDEDGAAVAVVAGIVDVLEAGRDVDAAPDMGGVVGFHNIFAAVVESAVAEKKTQAIEKKLRDVEVLPAPSGAQLPLDAAADEDGVQSLLT